MQICSILCFPWSILVKLCVYLRTSSSRTQMLLLEKDILLYSNCYIDTYVHKEADDFTLEDLEDIILFLGLNYISKNNFPAFFYNKARRYRSVISKYRPRNFIIDCDEVLFPFFFNKFTPNPRSGFFSGKGKRKNDVLFPSPPKKKGRMTTSDRRLILTSTTPLLPSIRELKQQRF